MCHFPVVRVDFHSYETTAQALCHRSSRPAPGEWVQHGPTFRASGQYTRLYQLFREYGKVFPLAPSCRNGPHVPSASQRAFSGVWDVPAQVFSSWCWPVLFLDVSRPAQSCLTRPERSLASRHRAGVTFTADTRLPDCLVVKIVSFAFCQQKYILMALCASVPYALRHGVWLLPDNILPQIPPIRPQGKSQHPRNTYQVFVLVPFRCSS